MMTKIDGFTIEPYGGSCFLFQWTELQHTFRFEITSARATLIETSPAGDSLTDANRLKSKAQKAADKLRRQMFFGNA